MDRGHNPTPPPTSAAPPLPPAFARPMSDGRLDPALVIDHDMACVRCGYNLRTRRMGEACPECGAAVKQSFIEPGPAPSENMYANNRSSTVCLAMGIVALILGLNTWGAAGILFGPIGIVFYYKHRADVRQGVASPSRRYRRIAKAGLICSWIAIGLSVLAGLILALVLSM